MRKYLGVLAGVASLCVMSWAQAPTQVQLQLRLPPPRLRPQLPSNSDSNSNSRRQPGATAPVSAPGIVCRRFLRRGRFFQHRTLGGTARLGRFSRCERDQLAGVGSGGRAILWNVEDSERTAGAVSTVPSTSARPALLTRSAHPRESTTFSTAFI